MGRIVSVASVRRAGVFEQDGVVGRGDVTAGMPRDCGPRRGNAPRVIYHRTLPRLPRYDYSLTKRFFPSLLFDLIPCIESTQYENRSFLIKIE